jgi:hypothetical protein
MRYPSQDASMTTITIGIGICIGDTHIISRIGVAIPIHVRSTLVILLLPLGGHGHDGMDHGLNSLEALIDLRFKRLRSISQ